MICAALLTLAQEVIVLEEDPDFGRLVPAVSVVGRMSFPSGSLSKGDVSYADNFDVGFGLGVELDLLQGVAPGYRIGGYFSASWDAYDGDKFTDDFGTSVDPEDLNLQTFLVGVKSVFAAGPGLHAEGRVGVGAAHNDEVDADVVDLGFPLGTIPFFDEGWQPAFELAGRFSWGTPSVLFGFGVGFRIQDGPEEADASEFLLDTDALWLFTLDVALTIRF